MDIFLTLFSNLLPLYGLIGLGFIGAKYCGVERDTLANLAIFICVPVVVFGFILDLDFQWRYLLLPIILYLIYTIIGLGFLAFGKRIYDGPQANILAMLTSMGNTGYFGLPLVLLLFPPKFVAIYVFMMVSGVLYEATIGYYIAARGRFNTRDSLIKLLKFPMLYAIVAAFIAKGLGMEMSGNFETYWTYFKGSYVIVGMMIIGAAMAGLKHLKISPRFLCLSFFGRFVVWPALAFMFVSLDRHVTGLFSEDIYKLIMIVAIVPPAANVAAYAAQLGFEVEKAATTILLGTIFALFYIPVMLIVLGIH